MGFWTRMFGDHAGITPNANPPSTPPSVGVPDYSPGDPHGLVFEGEETFSRGLPGISPSPWDGWPADWATPGWSAGIEKLVDTAWACLDLNSSVLASMPVYRLQSGRIGDALSWMLNPDPGIYTSWNEFAKQLFWDYQMGEVFVLPTSVSAAGFPLSMRVVPPWAVNVEMRDGRREYRLGTQDVTDVILHIRYRSTVDNPRGMGPLDASAARLTASGVLAKYVSEFVETGGIPAYWLEVERHLEQGQAQKLLDQWMLSRQKNLARPGVTSGGAKLRQAQPASVKDMALVELAQFTESRIAVMLGVPPFLVGLPSGGDSMTYSNVSSLFDYHDRSSLRPKASAVMSALSQWALPRGQSVELNRDEYTRPAFNERVTGYVALEGIGAISVEEIRAMERLQGDAPTRAPSALTGDDS